MRNLLFPLSVQIRKARWSLFAISYDTAEGTFNTYIYAISKEHAWALVAELKESAKVLGQVVGQITKDSLIDKQGFSIDQLETLEELVVTGPVNTLNLKDLNLIKDLIDAGLATPVVVQGREGFTCATENGNRAYLEWKNRGHGN